MEDIKETTMGKCKNFLVNGKCDKLIIGTFEGIDLKGKREWWGALEKAEWICSECPNFTPKISNLKISEKDCDLVAAYLQMSAVHKWNLGRVNQAIEYCERAISYLEDIFGKKPEDYSKKNRLYKYRSELAYYYVEAGRTDKIGQAIEFAKMGLEAGQNTDNLNLIDNYLYVIMKFSISLEDKKQWLAVFETYQDRIYKAKIRQEGDEQDEYNNYRLELKGYIDNL